jgi:cytochrome P450
MDEDGRYPNPMEFRLDRWLPKDHLLHNPKNFQEGVDYIVPSTKYRPFNVGPHICLGMQSSKLVSLLLDCFRNTTLKLKTIRWL